MMPNSFKKSIAGITVIALVLPLSFMFMAPKAVAQIPVTITSDVSPSGIGTWISDKLSAVYNGITAGAAPTTAFSTNGSFIYSTMLVPMARSIARMILQQITASTINWINGGNGTGKPSFVTNLSVNLQGVGNAVAIPFINQIMAGGFNSPFGPAIASSLMKNYSQQTSMAGFFAANQSTLARATPNVNSFLAGNNWTPGAWLTLTTEDNNNPYMLDLTAKSQLGSNVSQATTNRRADIAAGNGFLSWCGTTAAADQTQSSAAAAYQQCQNTNGVNADCLSAYTSAGGTTSLSSGVKPGDSCTNGDGTPGKTQTPGSIIHDYTQAAVVNSGIGQLINANDLDAALGAIVTALANQVLGSTGLLGASAPSSSRPALTTQLQTTSASSASAATSAASLAQTTLTQLGTYTSAWNSIGAVANAASTNIQSLINYCNAQAAINTQVTAAQIALTTEVAPVLAQVQTALTTAASTQALALKVKNDTTASVDTLNADIQALVAAPPSIVEVANAQSNAMASGGAVASPEGSLTVSGGSLIDQMNLINTNAAALKAICNPVAPVDYTSVMPAG